MTSDRREKALFVMRIRALKVMAAVLGMWEKTRSMLCWWQASQHLHDGASHSGELLFLTCVQGLCGGDGVQGSSNSCMA